MGKILASFFDKADKKGGLELQLKFALITKRSRSGAMNIEDSEENIMFFEEAFGQL